MPIDALEITAANARTNSQALTAWVIGDGQRLEFRDVANSLRASTAVTVVRDLGSALTRLTAEEELPDLIVLLQAWPGQFTIEQVDWLRRAAPLARMIGVLGSWCEGETRSGTPWPAVPRIYWHQWCPRFRQELQRIATGGCPQWGLPITATDDERLLTALAEPPRAHPGVIAIQAGNSHMADWLHDACRGQQWATIEVQVQSTEVAASGTSLSGMTAGIWEGASLSTVEFARLSVFCRFIRPAPVIALLDFPRTTDRDRALSAGATAVLSKPLLVADLLDELNHAAAPDRPTARIQIA